MKPIIRVENLSKQYTIGTRQAAYGTLRDSLANLVKSPFSRNGHKEENTIWALRDVSFDVMPGEVVGIIGRNGAGKSTLLKILSRIVEPTTGNVDLYGRVGSLLEVGTGFHPELSGRENIYLNGAILGMKRAEIDRKFDEIVDFAEIEQFIDTPVKHYSSGMHMRLAFAVAAHLEPEIMIVDEVLAVGDAEFQKKCIGKMGDISEHGRTVLFVSHNLTAVQSLCSRVIYLEKGYIVKEGDTKNVVSFYLRKAVAGQYERIWDDPSTAPGNGEIRLHSAKVVASDGTPILDINVNTPLQFEFDYWNYVDGALLNVCLIIKTAEGYCAFNTVSSPETMPVGLVKGRCQVPGKLLNDGNYSMDLCIVRDTTKVAYVHNDILAVEVKDEERKNKWYGKWIGAVRPRLHWDHFHHLSEGQGLDIELRTQRGEQREPLSRNETAQRSDEQELVISHLQKLLTDREETVQLLHTQLNSITGSTGWSVFQKLWDIRDRLRLGTFFWRATVGPSTPTRASAQSNGNLFTVRVTDEASPVMSENLEAVDHAESLEMAKALLNRSRAALKELRGDDIRAIAFYLPQFHPIPENDQWWGKGFTEWTNVTKARPNFEGHYQPHLPADFGFYDLRIPEVREQQAELARKHGIHGFCYYHYWFGGRRLLERPFNEVLNSGRPDLPFCLCWANENWTRRWDGAEREILMAQQHSDEDDRNFIRSLFPAFDDCRYIRVNGKPLLIVYRVNILPNARQTVAIWREEMKAAGLGDIYLCAAQSFGILDPTPHGFDAAIEFPPHGALTTDLTSRLSKLNTHYAGNVYDYLAKAESLIHKPMPDYTLFKAVMPAWDNTPRRQDTSAIYINSSPEAYEYWLGKAVEYMITRHTGGERLVFINAWNEWGEGAHLEPDRLYGHRYLEATRNVLNAVRCNR